MISKSQYVHLKGVISCPDWWPDLVWVPTSTNSRNILRSESNDTPMLLLAVWKRLAAVHAETIVLRDNGPIDFSSSSVVVRDVAWVSSLIDVSKFCASFVSDFVSPAEVAESFIGGVDVPRTAAVTTAFACTWLSSISCNWFVRSTIDASFLWN